MVDHSRYSNGTGGGSIHDPLTGAYSRGLLSDRLADEVERARRYDTPLSLCVLDLDHFKSVNDAYGHARGDQVLIELVTRLQGRLRRSDLLFRYGGDEFVLLLPHTGKPQAIALAQEYVDLVGKHPFGEEPPLTLSLSLGLASFPEDADDAVTLFDIADRRQYEAKRRGRGQAISTSPNNPRALVLQPPPHLIERDVALATMHRFLQQLPEMRRGVLGILGLPGAGRSGLLHKLAELAALRGYVVLAPHSNPTPSPYGALVAALWPGGELSPAGAIPDLPAILAALQQAATAPRVTGLLIAVDGWSALDRPTRNLLRHLLDKPLLPCLGLAFSGGPGETYHLIDRAVPLREVIEIAPLSRQGVRVWVRSFLRWEPPPAFLDWLLLETDGLPALLQEGLTRLVARDILEPGPQGEWQLSPTYHTLALHEWVGRPSSPPAHNLPVQLTDFVGRLQECEQVHILLERSRLATLVGSAGIGKTRLALQVAAALLPEFRDGVRFVSLAEIRDPALIPAQIAQALGAPSPPVQDPLANLTASLHDKQMLLVLDNFEQVITGAPLVSALLAAAPELRILVTSREALRVYGEHVRIVPPLTLPDLQRLPAVVDLAHNEAIQLFTTRAQAAQFDFVLTPANAPAVAALCVALDGIPLALELAAARALTLTPQEMVQQVTHRLALLSGGPRDRPLRQQTLRGAIAWSYKLLSPQERLLFARLAVFAAGSSLPAVQAVCTEDGALPPDVQANLVALSDKSLINMVAGVTGGARFVMLETIREYAEEQLAAYGHGAVLRRQHAHYFCTWLAAVEPALRGSPQQAGALRQVEEECDNLRTALRWALDVGDVAMAQGIGGILWRFWAVRSYLAEGRRWLTEILTLALPPVGRAHILQGLGYLAMFQGDYAAAQTCLTESQALYQALGDQSGRAGTLVGLGEIALNQGRHAAAQAFLSESVALHRALDDQRGLARSLADLALIQEAQGQWAAATALLEESYTIRRAIGSLEGIALVLCRLGNVLRAQGAWEQAAGYYEESLAHYRTLGHRAGIAALLHNLGQILLQRGAPHQALGLFTESLSLLRDEEEVQLIGCGLAGVAEVLVALGHPERAARLFGAIAALESRGIYLDSADRTMRDQQRARAQAQLDEAKWAVAWDSGRALPLTVSLAYALEEIPLD